MRPERWRQVEHLYNQALEMEESQRMAFLREACVGDDELRHDIERLLEEPGSFLEEPALQGMAHEFAATAATSWVGRRIGNYEFVSLAGAGGMGEVYRARDTKLKREVAIKILPEEFARDPGRVSRFQREAQLLASLNHPNIAAIYDLEENDGFRFLILELAEGETLAERLKRGPIPLDDALQIATQIAEGLGAAHERGILHRDLKPANIKLTPGGRVKVLDFGLAKAFAGEGADVNPSNSPPMMTVSELGMILGTAAYMSPEQARGKAVDKRTDIWAFGCVLYEMLTGHSPFACDTMTDTLAAIVGQAPSWAALPASTPAQVRRLLFRCLEKDPRGRLHDIADARIEIEDVLSGASRAPAETAVVHPRQRSVRLLGSIAVIASLVALIAIGTLIWNSRKAPPRILRMSIASSGPAVVNPNGGNLAITPDARSFVYIGNSNKLFVHSLDQVDATPIYTAATPLNRVFVSPDGQWVGFDEGNMLKKVAITGGPAMTIVFADASGSNGAAWAPGDTIIFATNDRATGLLSVPVGGGDVKVLTRPVPARGDFDHFWPEMLPGGRAVLFTIIATTGGDDAAQVAVFDLVTKTTTVVLPGGSHAHYVPSGHLVYTFRGELRAIRFDLARLEPLGMPVTVLPLPATSRLGRGFFDVSADGTLAYVDAPATTLDTLVWADRKGGEEPLALALPPGFYLHPRVSPDADGSKVAVAGAGIFVWDRALQIRIPLLPGLSQAPVWTHNGRRLLFFGGWLSADGTDEAEPLGSGIPSDVTPDGTRALLSRMAVDIMLVALDGTRRVEPLIQTEFSERNGVVSPNGRWLAYESDRSGKFEIYVAPFPNVRAGNFPISAPAGGTRPLWSRNGQELFYVADLDGAIMAVRFDPRGVTGSALSPPVKVLEKGSYLTTHPTSARSYDVSPDGKRFLVVKRLPATQATQIIVVENWLLGELKRLVPGTR